MTLNVADIPSLMNQQSMNQQLMNQQLMNDQPTAASRSGFLDRGRWKYATPGLLLLLLVLSALSGCLSDPIDAPQVFYRGIFKPAYIARHDSNYDEASNTGDLVVTWGRSPSDTQLNFKGYYIVLYRSIAVDTTSFSIDSVAIPPLDSQHVAPYIHRYVFHGLKLGRYTAEIWGERYPDPAKPDSLALSFDYDYLSFTFDPRPVTNPTAVRAVSAAPNFVTLQWDLPACDTQSNFLEYRVYARKAFQRDSGTLVGRQSPHFNTLTVPAPKGLDTYSEAPYFYWVKSIRKDTVSSFADSATVTWSGAEKLPSFPADSVIPVVAGHGIFIGQTNSGYILLAVRNDSSMIQVQVSGGVATLSAGGATGASGIVRFVTATDEAPKRDSIYYSAPHALADYSATSLTLPMSSTLGGVVAYALVPSPAGTAIVRLFFRKDASSGALLDGADGLHVSASYQPDPSLLYY